jgi:hypothetical protein
MPHVEAERRRAAAMRRMASSPAECAGPVEHRGTTRPCRAAASHRRSKDAHPPPARTALCAYPAWLRSSSETIRPQAAGRLGVRRGRRTMGSRSRTCPSRQGGERTPAERQDPGRQAGRRCSRASLRSSAPTWSVVAVAPAQIARCGRPLPAGSGVQNDDTRDRQIGARPRSRGASAGVVVPSDAERVKQ